MKHATIVATLCIGSLTSAGLATVQAQTVQLTIRDGRVTLKAEQASVRQVLAEWERLGEMKVVGVDRLMASQPLTLTLNDVPERQALDIVLRTVPGYLAVDRSAGAQGPSRYDRLVLLPRTSAVASATPAGQAPAPAQTYNPVSDPSQTAMPDRADVEQFADADNDTPEPPMPGSPVINPYPGSNSGGPYGGNAPAGAVVGVQPPETQFDYANPQRYFEQMRQQQQQRTATPTTRPSLFPGSYTSGQPPVAATPTGPTATPTAPGTLARPGIAPTPTPAPAPAGQFFNPYNLPPNYVPPTTAPPPGNTVEPDRSKYANPYVPTTKPPE